MFHNYQLGSYRRSISAVNQESEEWFNRGLMWSYGFDMESAKYCFEQGSQIDPDCAMHYWGIAFSSGCYYNQSWQRMQSEERERKLANAYNAIQRAIVRTNNTKAVEVKLITALAKRYQRREPVAFSVFDQWNSDYADAMRLVFKEHPDDPDVSTLFADALICRTPWQLWNLSSGKVADGAATQEALETLEKSIACYHSNDDTPHPGLLHLHIHVLEMSPNPERATKSADALRTLVPDSGHLCHMPSHIDVRCGNYSAAVTASDQAIQADRKYLQHEGAMNFHTLSRIHNYHLKIYAAMFLGQYRAALGAAEELQATTPEALLNISEPAMADWMEGYMGMKAHVLIRFGKWREIIETPMPDDQELYCVTAVFWRYAKGVAYAATNQIVAAEAEQESFLKALKAVPESRYLFNNQCVDILQIAKAMLLGEIEYRKGNFELAFSSLREAVYLDDNLKYDEPWGWMQPVRHALGALLLEQGQIAEAMDCYRADLGLDDSLPSTSRHPNNIWSLQGYVECLEQSGQGDAAKRYRVKLEDAQRLADVDVSVSCFCRAAQ